MVRRLVRRLKRLRTPIVIASVWAIFWGLRESLMTVILQFGIISVALIIAHIISKEIFSTYRWDVGDRLNKAWDNNSTPHALLALAMLFARIVIYAIIILAVCISTLLLFQSRAFANHRWHEALDILSQEHSLIWPESDICIIAGQIEAESSWKENAIRVEKSGAISYGLMQVLDRTFIELRRKHRIIADLEPVDMLQSRYSIRAGLLYNLQMWNLCNFSLDERNRYAFMLASYNGGYGWILRDRKLTERNGYNGNIWFGNVERFSERSRKAFLINRAYPRKVFKYAIKYREVFGCQ